MCIEIFDDGSSCGATTPPRWRSRPRQAPGAGCGGARCRAKRAGGGTTWSSGSPAWGLVEGVGLGADEIAHLRCRCQGWGEMCAEREGDTGALTRDRAGPTAPPQAASQGGGGLKLSEQTMCLGRDRGDQREGGARCFASRLPPTPIYRSSERPCRVDDQGRSGGSPPGPPGPPPAAPLRLHALSELLRRMMVLEACIAPSLIRATSRM